MISSTSLSDCSGPIAVFLRPTQLSSCQRQWTLFPHSPLRRTVQQPTSSFSKQPPVCPHSSGPPTSLLYLLCRPFLLYTPAKCWHFQAPSLGLLSLSTLNDLSIPLTNKYHLHAHDPQIYNLPNLPLQGPNSCKCFPDFSTRIWHACLKPGASQTRHSSVRQQNVV